MSAADGVGFSGQQRLTNGSRRSMKGRSLVRSAARGGCVADAMGVVHLRTRERWKIEGGRKKQWLMWTAVHLGLVCCGGL